MQKNLKTLFKFTWNHLLDSGGSGTSASGSCKAVDVSLFLPPTKRSCVTPCLNCGSIIKHAGGELQPLLVCCLGLISFQLNPLASRYLSVVRWSGQFSKAKYFHTLLQMERGSRKVTFPLDVRELPSGGGDVV